MLDRETLQRTIEDLKQRLVKQENNKDAGAYCQLLRDQIEYHEAQIRYLEQAGRKNGLSLLKAQDDEINAMTRIKRRVQKNTDELDALMQRITNLSEEIRRDREKIEEHRRKIEEYRDRFEAENKGGQ